MDHPDQIQGISCDTLKILHLPPKLSHSERERLLKQYGAIKVKTINKSEKYTITFAKFSSKEAARQTFLRLHQLQVRGQRLSVEYARANVLSELAEDTTCEPQNQKNEPTNDDSDEPHYRAFLQKLNGWAFSQVFTQPPPPDIRYKYSPPTGNTLLRIAIQMLEEPAFYCQVLHLMNKMNLPPPFKELEPEFPFLRDIYDEVRYRDIFGKIVFADEVNDDQSEEHEESELETDEEAEARPKEFIPMKRKRAQSTKRLKIPRFVNPSKQAPSNVSSSQKLVKPEDVFESLHRTESKNVKIALKVDLDLNLEKRLEAGGSLDPLTSSTTVPQEEGDGGFGLLYPTKGPDQSNVAGENESTKSVTSEFITSEELAGNRISINDQRLLPVFKNYHPGKPSPRLYIKNLSKQVELKDLDFIYKKYLVPDKNDENDGCRYNVRLMQEGRMKGQAFITLQTTELAHIALEETNGYILKDKPMVVQFAKALSKLQENQQASSSSKG
ncbi:RNA-binding region-containing protein 3 isoform X2 [Athalia rosae]|uniref:RNA-binding region-containing protein 3 isoform X2 n=1 Tax=Athalia rosae TaxID=37344 RepID=UPI0020345A59|nr:RNA-binding region-containing protein 3 isoform X2 [Athalia rosae]